MEGDNLIVTTYTGIIADDADFNDILIQSEERLKDFIDCIPDQIPQYHNIPGVKAKPQVTFVDNTSDNFKNKTAKIDFLQNDVIVISGASISKIVANGEVYEVTYDQETNDNKYFAAIVKAPKNRPTSFVGTNNKPIPWVEQRAINICPKFQNIAHIPKDL